MATSSFDAQFLNIPIRAINVNGIVYPVVTREATIIRGVNQHDTIELSLLISGTIQFDGKVRIPLDANSPSSGTQDVDIQTLNRQPVSFVYGVSPQTEQFIGYVTAVTPEEKFKEGMNFKLSLTGASVVLQRVIRRFETLVTVPQAISNRVDARWLGFVGDTHDYQWPAIAQTAGTDWQMIVALAARIGWLIFTWGAVVRAQNPLLLFKQFPFTTLSSADDLLETDRKLMDFTPTQKSADLLDVQGVEVFYFDNSGNVATMQQTMTASNPQWLPYTETPVTNREEAQVLIDSANNDPSRWEQQAVARVQGDASFYPGLIVNVASGISNSDFNGRWLIVKVTHSMNRTAFQTELLLVRPLTIPIYDASSFQHFWDRRGIPRPTVFLRDGTWFSSISNPTVRALAS